MLGYNFEMLFNSSVNKLENKIRVSGNITTKNITGLKANTVYFASVRAYNTAGTGPSSPPVNVTTKKSRKYTSHSRDHNSPRIKSILLLNFHFIHPTSSLY